MKKKRLTPIILKTKEEWDNYLGPRPFPKVILDDFRSGFLKFLARCAMLIFSCSGLALLGWSISPKPQGVWTGVLISIALVAFLKYGAPWLLRKADLE